MGRPLPYLHGREGLPGRKSACSGQEAPGPVPTLCLCQGDRRFGAGKGEQASDPGDVLDQLLRQLSWTI